MDYLVQAVQTANTCSQEVAGLMKAVNVLLQMCERRLEAFVRRDRSRVGPGLHPLVSEVRRLQDAVMGLAAITLDQMATARAEVCAALQVAPPAVPAELERHATLASSCRQTLASFTAVELTLKVLRDRAAADSELLREIVQQERPAPEVVAAVDELFKRIKQVGTGR